MLRHEPHISIYHSLRPRIANHVVRSQQHLGTALRTVFPFAAQRNAALLGKPRLLWFYNISRLIVNSNDGLRTGQAINNRTYFVYT
jgi:hypothetical protein